ncbi:MAG: murein L,D-transpeptidase [Oxalobacteraceae bacterium]|nr:MAG: murein L,D-transpeptidase [Oxalobacteraceae bacterium]
MVRARRASLLLILAIMSLSIPDGAAFATEVPHWIVDGRPTLESEQALRILAAAGDDGLNPDDYHVRTIVRALDGGRGGVLTASAQTAVSNALTLSLVRLIQDMHGGRVSPRVVQASFYTPRTSFDAPAYLRDAVRHGRLPQAIDALRPQVPLYASLMRALARYRTLANDPALRHPLPPLPEARVAVGQKYSGLAELASRLMALGDLPGNHQTDLLYNDTIRDGVISFQERHGLVPDGILGRKTRAQLDKPVAMRVRQIELTLERLRWTPLVHGRSILVNLPDFQLHAYEGPPGNQMISMKVVIGKAQGAKTPQFASEVRHVEFNPYWNIPPAIARTEILPAVSRDPDRMARLGFEFVGTDGTVTDGVPTLAMEKALRGSWRLRQRPGPENPLGRIKFVMPNSANIFLHDTPAIRLFQRSRRDFSHGCIRVQDPIALARFVLKDQTEWSEDSILAAMESGKVAPGRSSFVAGDCKSSFAACSRREEVARKRKTRFSNEQVERLALRYLIAPTSIA